ncbi:MAG: dual specificity protein phosphatase family protein [Desulfobacteraceae bacterium]|nr:dual specificity protein phosphatase family protein [Desulfobacteraceae bacterium]MBC2751109.1 dual specificity protein phosphatase family protein [Desulfobacteraceae bacterium]
MSSNKKRRLKVTGLILGAIALVATAAYLYHVHVNYRFMTITEGKVYQSGAMPPEKLTKVVQRHHIKTVIDLRQEEEKEAIAAEHAAMTANGVRHVNIPSHQAPLPTTVEQYLAVMDDPAVFPVLIHCHHGVSRAVLFSALYRMEYEGWDNAKAHGATRFMTYKSSFDRGTRKGDFVLNYKPRHRITSNDPSSSSVTTRPVSATP